MKGLAYTGLAKKIGGAKFGELFEQVSDSDSDDGRTVKNKKGGEETVVEKSDSHDIPGAFDAKPIPAGPPSVLGLFSSMIPLVPSAGILIEF